MKQFMTGICLCWTAYCGAQHGNTSPLAFGMTAAEVETALGLPLIERAGRRGSEIFVVRGTAGVPGFYPTGSTTALQFRRGRLTGWKSRWQVQRPWTL
jgi:hypothetical protein